MSVASTIYLNHQLSRGNKLFYDVQLDNSTNKVVVVVESFIVLFFIRVNFFVGVPCGRADTRHITGVYIEARAREMDR